MPWLENGTLLVMVGLMKVKMSKHSGIKGH